MANIESGSIEYTYDSARLLALILTGFDDPMAASSTLLKLEQVNTYGHTKHGFTNPGSDRANKPDVIAYNAQSDRRSWAAMERFLQEIFAAA